MFSNRPSHSWDKAFSNFDLENPRSKSNDHDVAQLRVLTIPKNFKLYKSIQRFQRYGFCKVCPKCCLIWQVFGPWASPYGANGQITMILHNYTCYISRQVHETLNGVNPSNDFRYMRHPKSGPNLWEIWQFLAHGPPIWDKWANDHDSAQLHA